MENPRFAKRRYPVFASIALAIVMIAWAYLTVIVWDDPKLASFRPINVAVVLLFPFIAWTASRYRVGYDDQHLFVQARGLNVRAAGWPTLERRPLSSIQRLVPTWDQSDELLGERGNFSRIVVVFEDSKEFPLIRSWMPDDDFASALRCIWSSQPSLFDAEIAEVLRP